MAVKATFLMEDEKQKLVGETAKRMGISRSDFVRIAINEKLYRLGLLQSDGSIASQKLSESNEKRSEN